MWKRSLVLAAVVAVLAPAAAPGERGLLVGVADDALKWGQRPKELVATYRQVGLDAVRVTIPWKPGQTRLDRGLMGALDHNLPTTYGRVRVVFAVYGAADQVPLDATARTAYCHYVRSLLARYPTVNDVVIWNEVNSATFWRPQAGAAEAYEALLAKCWDVLHDYRRGVNLITTTDATHDPGGFIRRMGATLRASGRTKPIFDTVGHHPYPAYSAEPVWTRHPKSVRISQGDLDKLTAALEDAFAGTGQPLPGQRGVRIWYMEQGFQSPVSGKVYTGAETERRLSSDQGRQLADALLLAYCQPNVAAFFNFELHDEHDLAGWQSGIFTADGRRKPAYDAFRAAIAEVRRGTLGCVTPRR